MKNAHHALPTATFLLLGLFILLSCDRAPANFENGDAGTIVEMSARPARQSLTATRKLIRIAYLELEMKDIAVAKTEIQKLIKEFNAFTASEAIDHLPSRLQHQQTIRVPVDKFELLLGKLETLSVKVESKNIQSTDVTEEFIDKEARVKTKKELEARYREILKRAQTVPDMLAIEEQLNQVRADIEAMEGRLKYLDDQVELSTINLTYYQSVRSDFGFASRIASAMSSGWHFFLALIVGVLSIWPFILIGLACLYFGLRRLKINRIIRTPILSDGPDNHVA